MSKLVIAEKPSVAQSIAKVLGANRRQDGYLEGRGYIVSWCVGHLVELAEPASYGDQYAKWRKEDLPILPQQWQYQVSSGTKKQFNILKQLMGRSDVESLVCATDAGREGELIFRLVYYQCGCRKPFERLWISSMEDSAILEGFQTLRPGQEYDALYQAALCRERADWLVGINATRYFTCVYGQLLNVGRVMTPTLAMVVDREAEISAFVPEPFYFVRLTVGGFEADSERFQTQEPADTLKLACVMRPKALVRKVERKDKSEKPPALYDLTSLQRDANRILGYTAQQTLDCAQSLYEKKLTTYPRTDSRYLTDDMEGMLPGLVQATAEVFGLVGTVPVYPKQVLNSKKVSDHHAIIPTRQIANYNFEELSEQETEILRLVAVRLLCAVGEPYRFVETAVELECGEQIFKAKGKQIRDMGWKGIQAKFYGQKDESAPLPELAEGAVLPVSNAEVKDGKTAPPKHFTEDSLLRAMEVASADEFPEEAERKGIGTPATRAAIIEKLVKGEFLVRKGTKKAKSMLPTEKGIALIAVMPDLIRSPSMTAEWEEKLVQVSHGTYSAKAFMDGITGMLVDLIQNYQPVATAMKSAANVIGKCPHCGSDVAERPKSWSCTNTACKFALWKDNAFLKKLGKRMTPQVATRLVQDGRAALKDCKSQKTGNTYNATLLLSTEEDGRVQFSLDFPKRKR